MSALARKYGVQTTIYFPLVTAGAQDLLTGATDGGTDCNVIKDGGTSTTATNDFAEEGSGIYSLVLTATEMQAAQIQVSIIDSATKAYEDQVILIETFGDPSSLFGITISDATIQGTTSGTPTTTTTNSDLSGYANDELIGRTITFTSGTAAGQQARITDYASTNGVVTFTTITTAPASGDDFIIT